MRVNAITYPPNASLLQQIFIGCHHIAAWQKTRCHRFQEVVGEHPEQGRNAGCILAPPFELGGCFILKFYDRLKSVATQTKPAFAG
ncbi:hypothetical protein [Limnofasciculus baicalensis]|uniref:Uncharacterized protein n=1 Tax=Limnofasciculus baicalensis BBK-W-15 TaxID=2699891 RepID=A0AAE3KN59_9CYAN|nr:hypothetical protein [Limnofasciculus baicalensis]MCP2729974.1 hypothetical protein [Limnofasciculus baicalensis BBK-W-15]